jgi:hypothetical protein
MLEGEGARVEKKAGARNGRPPAPDEVPDVDTLAHDRVAHLGEVDPDLVRSARFEPSSTERGANQPLHDFDVCHRELALPWAPGGAAEPVPPVRNETAFDALRSKSPMGHGEVDPLDRVLPELTRQGPLGRLRPREQRKPRGLLVEPMDDEKWGKSRGPTTSAPPGLPNATHLGAALPFLVGNARDAYGLVDDDDVGILEHDDRGGFSLARPGGLDSNFLAFGQAEGGIDLRLTVDEHLAVFAEALCPGPREALMTSSHERGESRAGLLGGDDTMSLHEASRSDLRRSPRSCG